MYISPARDIYFKLEIDIHFQLDRHISPARERHSDCIQKFDFVEHFFCSTFLVAQIVQL